MLRGVLSAFAFISLTVLCWGAYGPVLHIGQAGMAHTRLRPFICVGLAYFVIAVIVPIVFLRLRGEKGNWTASGTIWSLAAGAAGAIGALGIILAFAYRGSPVYVMPLVFGCAPVINTFVTIFMAKNFGKISPLFYSGLILVAIGAVTVMVFKPKPLSKNVNVQVNEDQESGAITVVMTRLDKDDAPTETWHAANEQELASKPEAYKYYLKKKPLTFFEMTMIPLSIALTVLCWGAYGPVLHKGQMKMSGSRLRPLICVGLAYFAIAVVVPGMLLGSVETGASFTFVGTVWSLAAGATGAVGALGIIMAFNSGGKPILVMPLVFGGAPVVNTFVSIIGSGSYGQISGPFYGGLLVVIAGAVTVLVFAPKPGTKAPTNKETVVESSSDSASPENPPKLPASDVRQ